MLVTQVSSQLEVRGNNVLESLFSMSFLGGKWTTYRQMAEETVDRCVSSANLQPKNGCVTKGLILTGGEKWTPTSYIRLVQDYGIETEVRLSRISCSISFAFSTK